MEQTRFFDIYHPLIEKVINNVESVMIGKRQIVELSLTALLAEGHVLLEDVPGVGKTMMVRAVAKSIGASFSRIQFTPDLLPSDLTGVSIFNQKEMKFEFRPGPLMGNIILADEINRTSPKTQSALLESMEERSMTVDGHTYPLNQPFFVMATQNPLEYEGTYPLPEAQLDRFLLKLNMGYPTQDEELEILSRRESSHPIDEIDQVITLDELLAMQTAVKEVHVDEKVKRYIVEIVTHTRRHSMISLGASPRGSLLLMKAVQAYAYLNHRNYVLPDDVKFLAPFVLAHRMILHHEARFEGVEMKKIVKEILEKVNVPIMKEKHAR
ncbi:AAA family ATPase [Bacillus taeanensis]|uniref:AAA family ATPase n=1 Tax=Bacillus taeanensis TaxID=273032 RepID=A0A366XLQ2_9BACI|nr:MoxR family ATPase [Bacillus taeanensis]RBW67300.1 AAA family ATPase [Bacillus taeanensis]